MKSNSKKELAVVLKRTGRAPEKINPSADVTYGSDYAADITVEGPAVAPKSTLIKRSGNKDLLTIKDGIDGVVRRGSSKASLKDLAGLGVLKKKGSEYVFELEPGVSVELKIGDATIGIGYVEAAAPIERLPVTSRLPFVASRDSAFLLILVASIAAHVAFVYYLGTIEIKKKDSIEEIQEMDPRFARLILTPKQRAAKKEATMQLKEDKPEKAEEKASEKEEEPKREDKKEPKQEKGTQDKSMTAKVKKKGVLGVIGAKGGLLGDVSGGEIWNDVDMLIAKAETSRDPENLIGDISGTGGLTEAEGLIEAEGPQLRSSEEIIREKGEKASFEKRASDAESDEHKRTEAEVHRIVKRYTGGLKYLYNNALRRDATLRGSVTIKFVITPQGRVSEAKVVSSTINAPSLEEEITKRILLWRFRSIPNGTDFSISYTFDFSPVG